MTVQIGNYAVLDRESFLGPISMGITSHVFVAENKNVHSWSEQKTGKDSCDA